ncbi:MAG: signal peptidase I [Deltaproteobacteria bacterium]|nr:signal peptidase I [Deltaproteobacteria bacterium]
MDGGTRLVKRCSCYCHTGGIIFLRKGYKVNKQKIREYAEVIFFALLIAFFVRTFIVQAFTIPSGSMKPSLQIGDFLLTNKLAYGIRVPLIDKFILRFAPPEQGDMLVFQFPLDRSKDFIKRVIAVPGDSVEIKNKQLFVNEILQEHEFAVFADENILPAGISTRDNLPRFIVPEDSFFVMGDNRDQSHDSRFWGFVKRDDILGEALIIYWSWDSENFTPRWKRIGKILH